MLRQRIHTRGNPLAFVGRLLVLALALALVVYGLALIALALKAAPADVQSVTGYRSAYDFLARLRPSDLTGTRRAIIAAAGLAAFLVFGFLALRELPRPYLARTAVTLDTGDRGDTVVAPRALERLAEGAALRQPGVTRAAGRYGVDELAVEIAVDRARETAQILRAVHAGVLDAVGEHELPAVPVRVTLTGFDRKNKRELS
jgi:hypothetical protein